MAEPSAPIDLAKLIKSVDTQAASPEPLDRLSTAVTVAESLNGISDALLDHYVEMARNGGHSWTEIGAAIGVSKQAAQQRFISVATMNTERLTQRAKRALVLAQEEAARRHHNYVGAEHLLAGLMLEAEGIAGVVLTGLGLTLDKVRQAMTGHLGGDPPKPTPGPLPLTPRARRIISDLVIKEALQLGHNYVGTEHLLLALCAEGENLGAQILAEEVGELGKVRAKVVETMSAFSAEKANSAAQAHKAAGKAATPKKKKG